MVLTRFQRNRKNLQQQRGKQTKPILRLDKKNVKHRAIPKQKCRKIERIRNLDLTKIYDESCGGYKLKRTIDPIIKHIYSTHI